MHDDLKKVLVYFTPSKSKMLQRRWNDYWLMSAWKQAIVV
jgi:hypothetical protein